jgi:hypothetical protein
MPQYDLGDDLRRNLIPGLKGDGVAEEIKMFRLEIHAGEIRVQESPFHWLTSSARFD